MVGAPGPQTRPALPVPRLRPHPLAAGPPHRPLGQWWANRFGQSVPVMQPPPPMASPPRRPNTYRGPVAVASGDPRPIRRELPLTNSGWRDRAGAVDGG